MMWPIYDDDGNQIGEIPGRVVSCVTRGCPNEGFGIEVPDNGAEVICGPCGQVIAPAQPPDEETTPETPGDMPGVSS